MPYYHLTPEERRIIALLQKLGWSRSRIAHEVGRSPSTVGRELRRNRDPDGGYCPHFASLAYWRRRKRCYVKTKLGDEALLQRVRAALAQKWSPEQIAGRWRYVEYPHDPQQWISYETIYRYVRADKAQGGMLYLCLRRGRQRFDPKAKARCDMGRIQDRKPIEERPAVVAQRSRAGDWEGDTFYVGRRRESCLVTLVERRTGFLQARVMPDSSVPSLNAAVTRALQGVPQPLRRTLTVDNGKEFAGFKTLEAALGFAVYFAHPYCAWERALNENTNGLLRQYFPKKNNRNPVTEEELQLIVDQVNHRPRKRLDYQTPDERYSQATVALDS